MTGCEMDQVQERRGRGDGGPGRHVPSLWGHPRVRASQLLLCRAAIARSLDCVQEKPDILIVL